MTTCTKGTVEGNVFICDYPIISYGSVHGGIPTAPDEDYYSEEPINLDKWCKEMGFHRQTGDIETEMEWDGLEKPQGWVFECTTHDSSSWHWCDSFDGKWLNGLGNQGKMGERVKQVKCEMMDNNLPACLSGNKL